MKVVVVKKELVSKNVERQGRPRTFIDRTNQSRLSTRIIISGTAAKLPIGNLR